MEIKIDQTALSVRTAVGNIKLEFSPAENWVQTGCDCFICSAENWQWRIQADSFLRISCCHTGDGLPAQSPECILQPEDSGGQYRMLIHHPTFGYSRSGISRICPSDEFFGDVDFPESCLFTVLYEKDRKQGIFAGFQPPVRDDSLLFYRDGRLHCLFYQTAPTEKKAVLDTLIVNFGNNPVDLLSRYADLMPPMRADLQDKIICGWNSWDYYFQTVEEEDIEENLQAIRNDPVLSSRLEYIIIDDGWQIGYGNWKASAKFHGSLEGIVSKIRAAGFKPGIWAAPFMAEYYSRICLKHPEMLARNKEKGYTFINGGNGGLGTLDPTHPETEKMIRELFSYLRSLGFEYFKIDFVKLLMTQEYYLHGDRRQDVVEHGMKIIREAIGPDAVLTGCGMPVYSGYGIVDSMRVAGDISTFWSNVLLSARELSVTFFFHRKAWINDSDFLLVRSPLTTDEKMYNPFFQFQPYQPFLSRSGQAIDAMNEIRVWCSLVILSGGNIILGDHIGKLNSEGMKLIYTVLEYTSPTAGIPLDLVENGIPCKWRRTDSSGTLYAFFNWENTPQKVMHDFACDSCVGLDLWTGQKADFPNGVFEEILPARSVRMILFPKH